MLVLDVAMEHVSDGGRFLMNFHPSPPAPAAEIMRESMSVCGSWRWAAAIQYAYCVVIVGERDYVRRKRLAIATREDNENQSMLIFTHTERERHA